MLGALKSGEPAWFILRLHRNDIDRVTSADSVVCGHRSQCTGPVEQGRAPCNIIKVKKKKIH